jgi:hypothetical protein
MIFFSWSKRINIGKWHYLLHTLIHCSFLGHYSVLSKAVCLFYLTRCNHPRTSGQPTVIHHWYLIFPMPMIFGEFITIPEFWPSRTHFCGIYKYLQVFKILLKYLQELFVLYYTKRRPKFLSTLFSHKPSHLWTQQNVIIFCQNVKVWLFT